jgi:hypothetical protein
MELPKGNRRTGKPAPVPVDFGPEGVPPEGSFVARTLSEKEAERRAAIARAFDNAGGPSGNPFRRAAAKAFLMAEEPLIENLDDVALVTSPVPVLGDVTGAAADVKRWYEGHISPGGEEWGITDYALAGLGLLPVVPAAAAWGKYVDRAVGKAKREMRGNTADVARRIADPALDMSDAARMARADAMQFKVKAFHGTPNKFEVREFSQTNDIGYHFGTRKAADDRLDLTAGRGQGYIGEFRLRAERPLDLPDLGDWNPGDIVAQARKRGAFTNAEAKALRAKPGLSYDDVKQALKEKGYDSIRYKNRVEDPGSVSWIVFDPDQIRHIDAGFDPAKRKSGDILSSLPQPIYG